MAEALAEPLAQLRSRSKDAKLAAVTALAAAQQALPLTAKDRAALHKLAHDAAFAGRDSATAALASSLLHALGCADPAENDAAALLLRKHAFTLGFEGRPIPAALRGAVPLLITHLGSAETSAAGRKEAAGALMNLAWKSEALSDAMRQGGALPLLVRGMSAEAPAELENAAGALLNVLSHGDAAAAVAAAKAGVVAATTERLLAPGKNKLSRFGAKLLSCAAASPADARQRVVADVMSSGAVPHIGGLAASSTNRDTRCAALYTVSALGECGSAALTASLLGFDGLLRSLRELLLGPAATELRAAAAQAAHGLAAGPAALPALRTAGIVEGLEALVAVEVRVAGGAHPGVECAVSGAFPIVGVRYSMREGERDVCAAVFAQLPPEEQALYEAVPVACDPGHVAAQVAGASALCRCGLGEGAAAEQEAKSRAALARFCAAAREAELARWYAPHEGAVEAVRQQLGQAGASAEGRGEKRPREPEDAAAGT